tara:strand:- start:36 stop:887 length:852 start_codon:yes stop_codon:yes gene_type:complete
MINLITSFFIPKEAERQEEILKCLKYNVDCPYFKKIYLFIEKKEDIDFLKENIQKNNKINIILWNKQPTYADYLKLANQLQGEICMISNADIWLKKCDSQLLNLLKQHPNIGYSLTRHEYDMSYPEIKKFTPLFIDIAKKNSHIHNGSYDSFIFRSPKFVTGNINHVQNIPGSEHIFKIYMERTGIHFYNPCKDLVIVHEHKSNIRNYKSGELMISSNGINDITIENSWENPEDYPGFNDPTYPTHSDIINTFPNSKQNIVESMGSHFEKKKIFSTVSQMFSR